MSIDRSSHRLVVFFLSPRIIDFDSYLPVAMELKSLRPQWEIRFVTFAQSIVSEVERNATFTEGLAQCGTLHCYDAKGAGGWVVRQLRRVKAVSTLLWWIVSARAPVLFSGLAYDHAPYSLFYLACKLRRGRSYVLFKGRATDENIHLGSAERLKNLPQKRPSLRSKIFGHWFDALVHYHDKQESYLYGLGLQSLGTDMPRIKVGLPTLTHGWKSLVADQADRERARLREEGLDLDGGVIAVFPAKAAAKINQRVEESPKLTFRQVMTALRKTRPNAIILIRPHPIARNESFLSETIAAMDSDRIRTTDMHPDVMIEMADRIIVNGATNLQTTSHNGRFVDCTDYRDSHFDTFGQRSIADGYGTVYINPNRPDFEDAFGRAICDETEFDDAEITRRRESLIRGNPVRIEMLVAAIESTS